MKITPSLLPGAVARARARRGLSLIEALVAFAVMGFGMLGVLGIQATLRSNADQAKQRTEAVRIAQEALENWRNFSVLTATPSQTRLYADIDDIAATAVTGYTTNTTYTLTGGVVEAASSGTKTVIADVTWTDRAGVTQSVRLASLITGVAPELAATVATPGAAGPARSPGGRSNSIPVQARDFGNGRSGFIPPQLTTSVGWLFNNVTGLFTVCATTATDNADLLSESQLLSCGTQSNLLLQGYVRYATSGVAPGPTAADVSDAGADGPDFPRPNVSIVQTIPIALAATRSCLVSRRNATTFREYYCAVPVNLTNPRWSGSVVFSDNSSSTPDFRLASSVADPDVGKFRVCRYFTNPSYSVVTSALFNQNYVVIRAGSGVVAFVCPSPPTLLHQPLN